MWETTKIANQGNEMACPVRGPPIREWETRCGKQKNNKSIKAARCYREQEDSQSGSERRAAKNKKNSQPGGEMRLKNTMSRQPGSEMRRGNKETAINQAERQGVRSTKRIADQEARSDVRKTTEIPIKPRHIARKNRTAHQEAKTVAFGIAPGGGVQGEQERPKKIACKRPKFSYCKEQRCYTIIETKQTLAKKSPTRTETTREY